MLALVPIMVGLLPPSSSVVGSRFLMKNSLNDWSIDRKVLTYLGHFVTNIFLKLKFDSTCGFRVYDLKKIPGVTYLSFGENFTTRAQGYTHGIIVRFESKQAGDDYQTHELHVTVLGLLKQALETNVYTIC